MESIKLDLEQRAKLIVMAQTLFPVTEGNEGTITIRPHTESGSWFVVQETENGCNWIHWHEFMEHELIRKLQRQGILSTFVRFGAWEIDDIYKKFIGHAKKVN